MINTRTISYPFGHGDLQMRVEYNANQDPLYLGYAAPGSGSDAAVWQIRKYTYDANNNVTLVQFAGGTNEFARVWDNRAGYSYG